MKVMFHVQHLLGIGHQQRAMAIARALTRAGSDVVFVSGGMPDGLGAPVPGGTQHRRAGLGRLSRVQLPPARSGDLHYSHLVDAAGRPVDDDWRAMRRAQLLSVFAVERPDALVLETFPFGRKLLAFELLPLLDAARAARPRPLVVCSIRDIIEPRDQPRRYRQMTEQALHYMDRILVHSDPSLIGLEASFPVTPALASRMTYTGFVAGPVPRLGLRRPEGREEILVSAGGGAVGASLYQTAIAAHSGHSFYRTALGGARLREGIGEGRRWRVLAGSSSRGSGLSVGGYERLSRRSRTGTGLGGTRRTAFTTLPSLIVEANRRDFPALLRRCRVSVSQAGYNTVIDLLRSRCRSVLVPYASAGQREQGIRAALLAERGLVRVLDAGRLSPSALLRTVCLAARSPRPAPLSVQVDGAETAAAEIIRQCQATVR